MPALVYGCIMRAMAGWDEDSVTMAVEAARDCLNGSDRDQIDGVYFASTTMPFADRQNAGIVAGALTLSEEIQAADISSSQRAATTARHAVALRESSQWQSAMSRNAEGRLVTVRTDQCREWNG